MGRREKKVGKRGSAGNNRKTGEDFLLKNLNRSGVVETDSGLQYMVVEQVDGEKPNVNSVIEIHQRALLLNGTILEDTYRKNEPANIPVNELIEGLQEGVALMGKGSRYKFWVPYDLAWGKKGSGNKIPPYSVLSFDIRLLSLQNG
ncbi:FKBP-type peptidyl-prolyl cis-trans isomerase [Marinilabiliaceae bacterium ANBcel2]|nr:FKBP-type peptidyl-prolyl cis-trans isomerase [Marinilabiliaceae bacterium ANBcel2]